MKTKTIPGSGPKEDKRQTAGRSLREENGLVAAGSAPRRLPAGAGNSATDAARRTAVSAQVGLVPAAGRGENPVSAETVIAGLRQRRTERPAPALCGPGPRLLFFSGGTALRETAGELACRTRNTVHLVTPFDSGGSSAVLRQAFAMPAVGDARARILALADHSLPGIRETHTLLSYRLPGEENAPDGFAELRELATGRHPLLRQTPYPAAETIRGLLQWILSRMPAEFSWSGASVGNLVAASWYLQQGRGMGPALRLLSGLVRARGLVRPVVDACAHLAVQTECGRVIVGQHRFTGKEKAPLQSPVKSIWLAASERDPRPVALSVSRRTSALIRSAACICYPVGSFYSSLMANLLPQGVGRAVASSRALKVFVPNPGPDPELAGHTLAVQVERLAGVLQRDAPGSRPCDVLNLLLVDTAGGRYEGGIPWDLLDRWQIAVLDLPLMQQGRALLDPRLLTEALLLAACSGQGVLPHACRKPF